MLNKNKVNLSDYEAQNYARLQKMLARKWEFIYMQAEAQSKVDKKREKTERKILESQERAFWDVHRPMVSRPTFGYLYKLHKGLIRQVVPKSSNADILKGTAINSIYC